MPAIVATVLVDLGFSPQQGEYFYLILRLPGAAVHALEQQEKGWRQYPFFSDALQLHEEENIPVQSTTEERV